MTDAEVLAFLDDQTAKWSDLAAQYYRRRDGESGRKADITAASMQAAAKLIRELQDSFRCDGCGSGDIVLVKCEHCWL